MSSEIQTQIDENSSAASKAAESKAKANVIAWVIFMVLLNVLSRVLEHWIAMPWAWGISLLIVGLAFFPFRHEKHRAVGFGKWSLMVLLISAGATLVMFGVLALIARI